MGCSRALVTIFLSKIDLSHNRVLLVNCVNLVYKMIKYVMNRSVSINIFGYDTCRNMSFFGGGVLVSFHHHKNIISRRVHINVTQHMVMKTQTCTNLNFSPWQRKNIDFYMSFPVREINKSRFFNSLSPPPYIKLIACKRDMLLECCHMCVHR